MKYAYPVIITKGDAMYLAHVPDIDIDTQGVDIPDTIQMARDAINLWGVGAQDMGLEIPEPSGLPAAQPGEIVTLVDVDFDAYRKILDTRAVRKTVSIPAWMDEKASEMGISLSKALQEALKEQIGL